MCRKSLATVLSMGILVSLSNVRAEESRDPGQNAALQYWPALAVIPSHPWQTQWEITLSPLTTPVKDAEFLLVGSGIRSVARSALNDLRRGATMPYCEWGLQLHLSEGPNTPAHHRQRFRMATGLLLLSARLEQSRGDWSAAVDDLNVAWVFLRHLAHDGIVPTYNYREIENSVAPLAASWLPDLEESAVLGLQEHLEHLEAPPSTSDVVQSQKKKWLAWIRDALRQLGFPWIQERLLEWAKQHDDERLVEALKQAMRSESELLALMEDTSRLYDECAQLAALPLDQFDLAASRFEDRLSSANPLARLTLGNLWSHSHPAISLRALRRHAAKSDAMSAMFRAAIALRLEGSEGFEGVRDPFGDGPFAFAGSEGSYTLTSALTIDGEPFSMKFGKGAVPASETKSRLLIYDPDADAAADIQAALEVARRENKRLLLQFGFNGCIPCYALHRTFDEDEALAELLRTRYIHLAVDVTNDANQALYSKYDVQMPGVPHLTILNAEGEAVANVKPTEQFYMNGSLEPRLLQAFLEKWSAETPATSTK